VDREKLLTLHRARHLQVMNTFIQAMVRFMDRRKRPRFGDVKNIPIVWPEERTFALDRIRLSALHWPGTGTPLVMLHGLNANPWAWARMASILANGRELYVVAQRGHGGSEVPPQGYGLDETTADLYALLDRIAPGPIDLAGESWGGKVAMHFAARHPQRLRALILADPVMPFGFNPLLRTFPSFILAAMMLERSRFRDREDMLGAMKRVVYLPLGDEIDRRSWEGRFAPRPNGGYGPRLPDAAHAEIIATALARDISKELAGCAVPMLLLVPDMSVTFWPGELKRFMRLWRRGTLRRVAGDHTFVSCNPIQTAQEIDRFLSGQKD